MRLEELGEGCLKVSAARRDVEVEHLTCDSRQVRPGSLFVAVPGEQVDGHGFVRQAVAAGAVAIVGEQPVRRLVSTVGAGRSEAAQPNATRGGANGRCETAPFPVPYFRVDDARTALGALGATFYGHAHGALEIVGITGTKGKTTTAWILEAILRTSGRITGLFGTVHNRVGMTATPAHNTTPSSLELHEAFRQLVDSGGSHVVMEVSSHGIAQKRTAGFDLSSAIFTNIAPEHLDYHGTFENYFATKKQLFCDLRPDAHAILPREDEYAAVLRSATPAEVVWYGTEPQDGVEDVRMAPDGTSFVWRGEPMRTRLWGEHNLLNILAAVTAADCLGLTAAEIAAGVEVAAAPPGRLQEVPNRRNVRVFVDYAHTDGALETVLSAVRGVTTGRVITVFGCGGDRDREKRPRMGRVAERGSDHIVVTSDNPRSENPESILSDIRCGLARPDDVVLEPNRRDAIALAIRMARAGDTVLIAGKGHETYQEFDGSKLHFDDREVAAEFLSEGIGGN